MNNLQKFTLRPATEDDLPAIKAIEDIAYPLPWTLDAFKAEMSKPFAHFMVLTDDETDTVVAGYIVYWLMFEECHILNVAVGLDHRGQGFGNRMVRHAMNHALKKEAKKVYLEVRKSNEGAIQMYQKLGFFIDHLKKEFYSDKEDAYFMVRYLDRKLDI